MRMSLSGRAGDRLVTVMALVLAMGCGGFGGLMIVRLERMDNPPAVMGLDFSQLRRIESVTPADPMATGSISQVRPKKQEGTLHTSARATPAALDFRLLSVIDGVAFVEVAGPSGKELWPVDVGAVLPGAGQVTAIRRDGGRWSVKTPAMTITSERQ